MEKAARSETRAGIFLQTRPEPLEIDPVRTGVVVIDMQNAFVSPGGFFDLAGADISLGRQIVRPIRQICEAARARRMKVIYVVFRYSPDLREMGHPDLPCWHKEARFYREHPEWGDRFLVRGTWGAEIVEELRPEAGDLVVEKLRYSAFFGTGLDVILKTLHLKYLVFVGVATNICVEASLRDAYYHGYFPILIPDATAPLGPAEARETTVLNVLECYGWVTGVDEFVSSLG